MIKTIHIENIATYSSGVEFNPRKFSFIYGANGTGKSTLSKVLNNEITSKECNVDWDGSIKEEVVVYNRGFVEKNFLGDTKLKGIFTLGEESIEIQKEIDEKRQKIDQAELILEKAQRSIDVVSFDQRELRSAIEKKCWEVQKKYGAEFAEALVGYRNRLSVFCDKCIETSNGLESRDVLTLDELKIMYKAAFGKDVSKNEKYKELPIEDISLLDSNELLGKVIVGKNDTPTGMFIEYLQASDWIKTGIGYARKADGKCPYCQQDLPQNLQDDIEAYFDQKYEEKKAALVDYEKKYSLVVNKIKDILQEISHKEYSYIDYTEYNYLKGVLIPKLEKNQQIIYMKLGALSEPVEIETVMEIASKLTELIRQFNIKIEKNNEIVENQSQARYECQSKLWDFLAVQCMNEINAFTKLYFGKEKGKKKIEVQKREQEEIIKTLRAEIEKKESSLTSVKPTVDAINHLLQEFGFNGFLLQVNETKVGTYKIVRPTGEDASKTLSEGEHNFISFLYFYYLCFGSQKKTGLESKKVLVIDDPISSMDSNVLFIVSTLVKNIIRYCKNDEKGIKQVLILTHNVYFHKEITYWGRSEQLPETQTRYYILRKVNENTSIEEYDTNPINTSYELLWKELKSKSIGSANILLNVMRRILEHYFMVIGGINYEKCINQIEGPDKLICKSLISFINDGSHSVFEDLIFTADDGEIENYKRVFKRVFEELGHIDHYNMMMSKE